MQMKKEKDLWWQAFLITLGVACIVYIPYIIYNNGYFFFGGDFNAQQIPFYKLAHEAVRSGNLFWSWTTDLGANFIGSYSFYLLFSPFFWLTLPFPTAFVPHLMAPLLILKTACAALTSYLYLKRFVVNKRYAVIGSVAYAFSGFMAFNIFFNHFHDVVVFFPLMLVGLEKLITENKRGLFAVSVALCAMVNYWFFIGEAVFVILYVFVRMTAPDWQFTFEKFLRIGFEAVLGVLLAGFVLLPSVLALMGNPRTGFDTLLYGWNFWLYDVNERPYQVITSLFFPPDMPSVPNFFPNGGAKWASLSAFLPLFSMTGVISYVAARKKDWLRKMLLLCGLLALIPGFNSLFILLNHDYYARWFYMPLLLMATATVVALERKDEIDYRTGIRWTAGFTIGIAIAIGLTPQKVNGEWKIGLMQYRDRYFFSVTIAILGLLMIWLITKHLRRNKKRFQRALLASTCVLCAGYTIGVIGMGSIDSNGKAWYIQNELEFKDQLQLDDSEFARADFFETVDNAGMYLGVPNIQAFHSIVPVSIMEFYPKVGVKRDVSSKPDTSQLALRSLLSVKWLFIERGNENQEPMDGFHAVNTQGGYNIYENENFIPMGFAYNFYIDDEMLNQAFTPERARLMLKGVHLDADAIERNRDILAKLPDTAMQSLSNSTLSEDVAAKREQCCYEFKTDNYGFDSKIKLDYESLVFYSVPYEAGWRAYVNGEEVPIEKANVGFMAVRVPAGDNTIRFAYRTPGLQLGILATGGAAVVLLLYALIANWIIRKRQPQFMPISDADADLILPSAVKIDGTPDPSEPEQQSEQVPAEKTDSSEQEG